MNRQISVEMGNNPSVEEVILVIKSLKSDKSAEMDEIRAEMQKVLKKDY